MSGIHIRIFQQVINKAYSLHIIYSNRIYSIYSMAWIDWANIQCSICIYVYDGQRRERNPSPSNMKSEGERSFGCFIYIWKFQIQIISYLSGFYDHVKYIYRSTPGQEIIEFSVSGCDASMASDSELSNLC